MENSDDHWAVRSRFEAVVGPDNVIVLFSMMQDPLNTIEVDFLLVGTELSMVTTISTPLSTDHVEGFAPQDYDTGHAGGTKSISPLSVVSNDWSYDLSHRYSSHDSTSTHPCEHLKLLTSGTLRLRP